MDQRWVDLAENLRELGLWGYLPDAEAVTEQQKVAEGGFPFAVPDEEPGLRYFFIDGESMAEGGVGRVLADMAPGLRECGVELQVEQVSRPDRVEDGDYVVTINGRRCVAWTPQDWATNQAWKTATVRPLSLVNELLAEAGCARRLYTYGAGNDDAIAWLLDPRVVAAVVGSGLVPERDVPVLAVAL